MRTVTDAGKNAICKTAERNEVEGSRLEILVVDGVKARLLLALLAFG